MASLDPQVLQRVRSPPASLIARRRFFLRLLAPLPTLMFGFTYLLNYALKRRTVYLRTIISVINMPTFVIMIINHFAKFNKFLTQNAISWSIYQRSIWKYIYLYSVGDSFKIYKRLKFAKYVVSFISMQMKQLGSFPLTQFTNVTFCLTKNLSLRRCHPEIIKFSTGKRHFKIVKRYNSRD